MNETKKGELETGTDGSSQLRVPLGEEEGGDRKRTCGGQDGGGLDSRGIVLGHANSNAELCNSI